MIGDMIPAVFIPPQVKIILAAGVLTLAFFGGFGLSNTLSNTRIANLKLAHTEVLNKALDEKAKEEARARKAEQLVAIGIDAAATDFERKRQNEKAADARTIADLRNDVNRLRVSTRNAPRIIVPGAPTSPGRCDGEGEQTLAPAVAARLAERYADFNAVVDQLELCQATLVLDRQLMK